LIKRSRHIILFCLIAISAFTGVTSLHAQDTVADNMLLYQRTYGGWPKHIGNEKIDYKKQLSPAEKASLTDDASLNDGTIDNEATNKEIRYLLKAYKKVHNPLYLAAAERGVQYLLRAQYTNGGWPQFFPDTASLYRGEITYNDNAMINTLNVLLDIVKQRNNLEQVNPSFIPLAKTAVDKGIDCILKTQVKVNGKLTVWCAQHNQYTFEPAKARSYELPSLSGSESVGIVEFLMKVEHPSPQIVAAINAAVDWFKLSIIKGYDYKDVPAPGTPKGKDRLLVKSDSSTLWARFYDLQTNKPFFSGRDGIKKKDVREIEYERRTGYGWYGHWPEDLLNKKYPDWLKNNQGQSIIVDINGSGNFTSIQSAINSLANDSAYPRTIFIKKGVYNEKISIEKNNIILIGEDKGNTILTQAIARDIWRCTNNDDWGVATLNLKGNDIELNNLTIQNTYGFENEGDIKIICNNDTGKVEKKVTKSGHQMALRSFSTRIKVINCILKAYGGDTVSPWDVETGMFYFKDCRMEGGVDFFCPRGWSLAENCEFVSHTGPAAIWHDGSKFEDSKTVLLNCKFSGYDGFKLGRYHRDAQFYLINCFFAQNMADTPIYRVKTNNVIQWGHRVYFYNCHRTGGDYKWFENNLETAKGSPKAEAISPMWLFGERWNPLKHN
jgi:pectinesterase